MANSNGNKKLGKIIGAVAVVAIAAAGISYFAYQKNVSKMEQAVNVNTYYEGITVNGISLGGLDKTAAKALLDQNLQSELDKETITIQAGEKSFEIDYSSFGAKYDIDKALEDAYAIGRDGSLKERYEIITNLKQKPQNIEAEYFFDEAKTREQIEAIEKEVKVEAQDSTMKRENGTFVITDEKAGFDLDIEQTLQKVKEVVAEKKEGSIDAVITEIQPQITKAENQKATDLIGSFYTTFSSGAAGRNENLRVGCANINGTVVPPGGIFSMNESLGPQTYANGYRNAAVIVNGKIEDGLAGGVCQITTTLYNAVIFAELDVVERRNHSLAVAYVPLGRDAAVAGDYTDFKFKNNTEYPVYVEAYLSGNKLITNVYGHEIHDSGREVEFEKVFLSTIQKPDPKITEDPNLPKGEKVITYNGKTGSKVSTYKKVFQDGQLVSREWFSDSTYKATADEVTVGTKKTEAAAPAAKTETQPVQQEQQEQSNEEVDYSAPIGS